MSTAVELATGYVSLSVETSKVGAQVGRAFQGAEREGTQAGQKIGQAMAKSFERTKPDMDALAADVDRAEQRMTTAIERNAVKQENAKRKVDIAQAKLNETIEKSGEKSSAALTAQDRLSIAQQKLEGATMGARKEYDKLYDEVVKAHDAFDKAEKAASDAARGSETAAEKYASGWRGVGQKIRRFVVGGVDDATDAADREAGQSQGAEKYASGWRGVGKKLTDDLKRGVKSATDKAEDQAERGGREAGDGFKSAFKGAVAGMAAYVGVQEIGQTLWSSVQGAGDLEQSVGAISTIFGDSSAEMLNWSDSAASAVGLSKNQFNELGTLIGSQLKNGGTAMDELGPKTNELIGLGADLSSMFGGETSEAVEALSSALKGERDPIEKYGVSLNQAAIDAKAAELGFEKTGGALSAEANQAATLALIMDQTSDAHGNFARESDTFAHKQQVMAAQWDNLKAKMGELFLPVLTKVFGFIGEKAIPAIETFAGGLRAFGVAWSDGTDDITSSGFAGFMEGLANTLRDTYDWLSKYAPIWGPFAAGIGIVAAAYGVWAGVSWALTAAQGALATAIAAVNWPIVAIIAAIGLLVGGFILAYNRIGWFKDAVNAVWDGIKIAAQAVVTWFQTVVWPAFQAVLAGIGAAFTWLWVNIIQPTWAFIRQVIGDFVTWFQTYIWPIISSVLAGIGAVFTWLYQNVIKPIWAAIPAIISFAWNNLIKPIFQALGWFITNVLGPVIKWLYENVVKPAFNAIGMVILFAWNNLIKPIFQALVWFFRNVVGPVFTWLYENIVKPVFNWVVGAIRNAWENGIKPILSALNRFVRDVVGPVFNWLYQNIVKPVFKWIAGAIRNYWENGIKPTFNALKQGIAWVGDRFSSVRTRIGEIWQNLRTLLYNGFVYIRDRALDPLRTAARRVQTTFENVKNGIKTAWDKLKEAVKSPIKFVVDKVVNPFIGAYNKSNNFWSGKDIDPIELGFARGGVISGYEPRKKDDRLIPMRSGEGVLVPEVVRGLGAGFVHAANRLGNSGGVQAVRSWAEQGFAKGGVVGSPLKGNHRISQYPNPAHMQAVDIATPVGTPIYATADGTVTWAGPGVRSPGVWGGNEIHISGGGLERWFAHLSQISVRKGQQVKKGDRIGSTGNTGISSGPHLHFGVFRGGWPNAVNALDYLGGAFKFDPNAPVGGGGSSWTDPIQWVKDKIMGVFDFVNPIKRAQSMFEGNSFLELGTGLFGKLKDGVIEKASQLADPIINAVDAVKNSGVGKRVAEKGNQVKVEAWALEALRATGQFGPRRFDALVKQAFIESGGDPNAQNNWDSNAKAGNPSKGIMQTIQSTFDAHAMPGRTNILDPVDNMVAAIRYAISRYGRIEDIWPTKAGYAEGGVIPKLFDRGGQIHEGFTLVEHRRKQPDQVLTNEQWRTMSTIAQHVKSNEPETASGMTREEMLEALSGLKVLLDGRELTTGIRESKRRSRDLAPL